MGVNATGHARDASPAIFGQPGTKCLISLPKFVKIVIKLPAELMRTVQPAFVVQSRHRDSPERESDSPYFAWVVTSSLGTFGLCLHVGINA